MKAARLVFIIIMLFTALDSYAQVKSRKTQRPVLHSIKLGTNVPGLLPHTTGVSPGIWYSLENRLSFQTTLNTEIGVESLDFAPTLRVEPRYYYSLKSRQRKGKNTSNFAAEYIAISVGFDAGNLSNETFLSDHLHTLLFPKWGIRRALGQHFIAEAAAGYGLHFGKGVTNFSGEFFFDLKIGYVF